MKIDPGTIVSFALLGGLGYVAYKFYKGDWALPSLPGIPKLEDVPGIPSDIKITLGETGIPGAIGDVIYNIAYPDNLRQETTIPTGKFYQEAEKEIIRILPRDQNPQPKQIVPRAVAMKVSSDIVEDRGFIPSMLIAPITIGAGLGAITQQERYYEALPGPARKKAISRTVIQRQAWKQKNPLEYITAAAIAPLPMAIETVSEVRDMARAGMIKPPSPLDVLGTFFPPAKLLGGLFG